MHDCLSMQNQETLEQDYRGTAVIHGFRFIPEIGGGCIMAHIDQAEAFIPLRSLQLKMAALALLFIIAATLVALAIGRSIAKPLSKLTLAIQEIIAGNYDARADESGSEEIITLARSFNRMAMRLHLTLGELREQQTHLEERVHARTAELEAVNRQLAILSMSDGLTGLANRRHLDEVLDAEWRRAGRQKQPLTLVMADVDHFKSFNDHYGHLEGDECLRRVGAVLVAQTRRAGELAARYGGEEFAIVLPGAELTEALAWAEETLLAVAELAIPHAGSEFGIVTLSLGLASLLPDCSADVSHLITEADKALYRAKAEGRNRVVMMHTGRVDRPKPTLFLNAVRAATPVSTQVVSTRQLR